MTRRHHIDDTAIEAFFTGNGAGDELASAARFAEELRNLARGPVPAPSAQLATMLAKGFSTEKGDLPATAASNVPGPAEQAAGLPKWRKRRMVIAGFISGLSVATKAAFGISMAAASVTAAGAAGALPDPVQHVVATAAETVTPFSFPDKANDNADFGGKVSTDARDGGVDGKAVSEDARENGDARRPEGAERPEGAGKPEAPGQVGLDAAGDTPAAGHAPTSVPSGSAPGSPAAAGLGTAGDTPAAGHTPESVPVTPPAPPTDPGAPDDVPPAGQPPVSVPPVPTQP